MSFGLNMLPLNQELVISKLTNLVNKYSEFRNCLITKPGNLGLQDSIVTAKNAAGEVQLFSYVRLFYALGLILAGLVANMKERAYIPLFSGCAMIISVLAISFLDIEIIKDDKSFEERLSIVFEKYNLTQKERESFERLVTTEMAAQEIADEMGISRRVLSLKIKTLQFIVDVKKLKRRYLYV